MALLILHVSHQITKTNLGILNEHYCEYFELVQSSAIYFSFTSGRFNGFNIREKIIHMSQKDTQNEHLSKTFVKCFSLSFANTLLDGSLVSVTTILSLQRCKYMF